MVPNNGLAKLLIQKGGRYGNKHGKERVYFDATKIMDIAGLYLSYYSTGNISSATFDNNQISNSQAKEVQDKFEKSKIYYDFETGQFIWANQNERGNRLVNRIFDQFVENVTD